MSQVEALARYELYIDGASVAPDGGEYLASQDPFTGKDWAMIARGSAVDVDRAVRAARRAFESAAWSALSASRRGALLRRLADLIGENAPRLAEIERRDNGKLAAEVVTQVNYHLYMETILIYLILILF